MSTPGSSRVTSIDTLRGLIMVIMALDHVRDFIHQGAMSASPTDLATTTPILFATRWITHICAPAFALTAGLGAWLWWTRRGHSRRELSRYLVTRGLWLMLLAVTVMRIGYTFNPSLAYPFYLLVFWSLGLSMVALAALVWIPIRWLGVGAVATILLHNLLDPITAAQFGSLAWLWNIVHQVGAFQVAGATVVTPYPLIPWVAVMALGFAMGPLYNLDRATRHRWLTWGGVAAIAAFLVLRFINGYGDPVPWSTQSSPVYTLLSFLNTTKYPASSAFLLMTLGPALLLLVAFERERSRPTPVTVIGRVPFFYYMGHFYLAHTVAVSLALLQYGTDAFGFIFRPFPSFGGPADQFPAGFGYPLWTAYLVWIAVVVAIYPFCRWYAGIKAQRRHWWLTYL